MEVRPCGWCNDLTDEWTIIAYQILVCEACYQSLGPSSDLTIEEEELSSGGDGEGSPVGPRGPVRPPAAGGIIQ